MNIALFTESYKPYISGVTVSVETLAGELRALGHRVYIFAPHYKGHKDSDRNVFRFPSSPTFYPGFRLAIPFSRKIMKEIPRLNLDVIHSHSPFQLGLLGRGLARKMKIPFVYTFHTLFDQYLHYVPLLPRAMAKRLISAHLRRFCNSSGCVITPSVPVKDFLEKEGIKSKLEVIPTGIDFEVAKNFSGKEVRSRHGISKSSVLLLYVGRLTAEKNLPFLFESFKLINRKEPNSHLMIVARGPKEKELKALSKKIGIAKNVTFVGQVKYPFVFDYYAASDIFVFSSTTETQGLVIGEAATSGLPVVAVDAAGVTDAIVDGTHGYLTRHDINEFSGKVIHLIKNEGLRKKMSADAIAHAKEHFSSRAYAKKAEKVYRDLLSC
jgi:glycosyltransferase involved in cell wall biosynthesis